MSLKEFVTSRILSRKLAVAALALVDANVLVWFGKIDGTAFAAILLGIVPMYLAAQSYVDKGNLQ
jgi:hypothetical protein